MQETETFLVNGQDFLDVDEFTYLEICKDAGTVKNIQSKMHLRETKEDLEVHSISRKTKLMPCKTPVLPVLLQGDVTWEKNEMIERFVYYRRVAEISSKYNEKIKSVLRSCLRKRA